MGQEPKRDKMELFVTIAGVAVICLALFMLGGICYYVLHLLGVI